MEGGGVCGDGHHCVAMLVMQHEPLHIKESFGLKSPELIFPDDIKESLDLLRLN